MIERGTYIRDDGANRYGVVLSVVNERVTYCEPLNKQHIYIVGLTSCHQVDRDTAMIMIYAGMAGTAEGLFLSLRATLAVALKFLGVHSIESTRDSLTDALAIVNKALEELNTSE